MSCACDDRPATVGVHFLNESIHQFWAKPARVAIELMFFLFVACDEMYLMPIFHQTKRDLRGGDSSSQNAYRLFRSWPAIETILKDVMDSRVISRRPFWPCGLVTGTDCKENLSCLKALATGQLQRNRVAIDLALNDTILHVQIGQSISFNDVAAMRIKKCQGWPFVRRGE